jgi:hypothetical protein
MRSKQTPKHKITLFEPAKIFLAILLVAFFFFAPVSQPEEERTLETRQEYFPTLHLFASSADACPFKCVRCTVWDPNAWPNNCVEYYCDTDCENDPGNGGGTQPPSINHNLDCQQPGLNGWCIGALVINMTASDPQGQQVIISGNINGANFTCTANPCSINLPEGAGLVSYRADSFTGLSASGSAFFYLDATTPQINGNISASPGINGWYNSQAFVTASASDALSGFASLEVNIDNTGWASYSDTIFTDGTHTIQFRASDNAGNVAETDIQVINVDTTAPTLNLAATGTTGQDGWYISAVTLTPTASDDLSGLASLEVTIDGITWNSVHAPITLSDGTYTMQFRATDQAGNVSLTPLRKVNIDATTPSLNLNIIGTKGQNSWYVTHVSVTPNASDAGAGINKIEAAVNQGTWTIIASPLSFTDGIHSYQIRVTDNAGNVTETPVLSLMVDTIAPAIAIDDDTLHLGDTLYYNFEDLGSGLWINRTVIEDDDEKYKKVVWLTEAVGQKANGEVRWDGIFADSTRAALGEYFITLKISDRAGNETMRTAVVKVTPLSALIPIPAFTPPSNPPLPLGGDLEEEETPLEFGGMNNGNAGGEVDPVISGGQAVVQGKTGWTSESTSFSSGNQSANLPSDTSNILWGATAAAVLGMTLADWQRKREEEEAARRAAERAKEIPDDVRARRRAMVIAKNEAKRAQERAWEQAKQAQNKKPEIDEDSFMQKTYKKILSTANVITGMSTWKTQGDTKAKEQAHQNDVSAARWAGSASVAQAKQSVEPSKWEQTVSWIDQHQPLAALGAGSLVALAAIAIVVVISAPISLPLIAATALAAAATTTGLVTAGTIALNNHYDRPATTNLASNILLGVTAAVVVSGLGLSAIYLATNLAAIAAPAITSACAANPNVCSQIGPAIDMVEQGILAIQFGVQTITGNPEAPLTYVEWQLESNDGGIPGNLILGETAEQLAKLTPEALELVVKHGDEIIPLLVEYGDDAVDIIKRYGDDGIEVLLKIGNNPNVIRLIKRFEEPAVELLKTMDVASAGKLLNNLDPDVLDYAMEQGPDALSALSRWKPAELEEFGIELALRSKKDAQVLEDISKLISLGPLDPKKPTSEQMELIRSIAENSMQYSENGQVVLGKWIDYGNGFTQVARETGSVHYSPHPDMWEMFDAFGNTNREEAAWLVNQQVIQKGVEKGLPFEYTLEGLPYDKVELDESAIEKIWEGGENTDEIYANIKYALGVDKIPVRLRELVELYSAGYTYSFDATTNSYTFIK